MHWKMRIFFFEGVQNKHFWFCGRTNGQFQWKSSVVVSLLAAKVQTTKHLAVTTVHFHFHILKAVTVLLYNIWLDFDPDIEVLLEKG